MPRTLRRVSGAAAHETQPLSFPRAALFAAVAVGHETLGTYSHSNCQAFLPLEGSAGNVPLLPFLLPTTFQNNNSVKIYLYAVQ
jgi:hypothetical protein